MPGYSGTALHKKLGLKPRMLVKLLNSPANYKAMIKEISDDRVYVDSGKDIQFVHLFTNSLKELKAEVPRLKKQMRKDGMIWVSWYKKAAKKETEITEDLVREIALANGLVDVKVCAVDEEWSGLKLVFRLKDR